MRSEMGVSENLHASIRLSRGLAASNRTIRHRNTGDLQLLPATSATATNIEASSSTGPRPIRSISYNTAPRYISIGFALLMLNCSTSSTLQSHS
jgi:hypothetical protein